MRFINFIWNQSVTIIVVEDSNHTNHLFFMFLIPQFQPLQISQNRSLVLFHRVSLVKELTKNANCIKPEEESHSSLCLWYQCFNTHSPNKISDQRGWWEKRLINKLLILYLCTSSIVRRIRSFGKTIDTKKRKRFFKSCAVPLTFPLDIILSAQQESWGRGHSSWGPEIFPWWCSEPLWSVPFPRLMAVGTVGKYCTLISGHTG